jgi:predicted fused transcriptional regulator/phosphomethylpyrimidine kinase/predicted transcriptional regulator
MRPPCEMVQREFLPYVRASLASRLREAGMSQNAIARRLNVTQAAVSKYLSQKTKEGQLGDQISALSEKLSRMIGDGNASADLMVREICSTCMYLRIGSTICMMHRDWVPSLGEVSCQICTGLLAGSEPTFIGRAEILRGMQEALAMLEEAPGIRRLMPQVRLNLVACDETASTTADVAAVPGRITLVENRVKALTDPQFGASRHTATLVLWAKSVWPGVRSCIGISGRSEIIEAAKIMEIPMIRLKEPTSDPDEISEAARRAAKRIGADIPTVAVHVPGGVGIEPILYLFGPSAPSLASTCISLSGEL